MDIAALQNAQNILTALFAARITQAASEGIASILIDGQQVTYTTSAQLDKAIQYWERRVAVLSGRRKSAFSINMDRF